MKKSVPNIIRAVLVVMMLSMTAMQIFWVPNMISYVKSFINDPQTEIAISILGYVTSFIISAIAIAVFAITFKFPKAIEQDSIFTQATASRLKLIAILILIDCILFAAGAICLLCLGEFVLSPAFAFFDVIGIALMAMLFILSKYVKDAAYLKEEADLTL